MLTKAYVEEIVDEYRVKVRIPIFNGLDSSPNATPTEQLSISPICTIPGGKYNYSVGDIVFVTFEDNDLGRPVILGQLYADIDNKGLASLTLDSLVVKQSTTLPADTSIGNVSADAIKNLQGTRLPIQQQIDSLSGGVFGVVQNNPYMNTIVQNFMEAHYVVMPNGNYIVDSFKIDDMETDYPANKKHYFYEFTENIAEQTEEIPIYNQTKFSFLIDLGNQWSEYASWYDSDVYVEGTPVYVVFKKDENNNISSASLFAQISQTGSDQMVFVEIDGTEVPVLTDTYEPTGEYYEHGNKKFWDLLLSNFSDRYVVVDKNGLPTSEISTDKTYFTWGVKLNDTVVVDMDILSLYPWAAKKPSQILPWRVYFSPLCEYIGNQVTVYFEKDGQPKSASIFVNLDQNTSYKYIDLQYTDPSSQTQDIGIDSVVSIVVEMGIPSFFVTYDGSNWSSPVSCVFATQTQQPKLTVPVIIVNGIKQSFQSMTQSNTISNVLQMIGVISLQLFGVNVQQVWGELNTPRKKIDLENWHYIQFSPQFFGYGKIPQATDLLWETVYGDNADTVNGLVYCRDILSHPVNETLQGIYDRNYRWTQALDGSGGSLEVLSRS